MTKPRRGREVLFKQIAENLLTIACRRTLHFSVSRLLQEALKWNHVCSHSTSRVTSAQTITCAALPAPPAPAGCKDDPLEPGAHPAELSWQWHTGKPFCSLRAALGPQPHAGHTHSSLWHTLLLSFSSHCHLKQKTQTPSLEEIWIQHPAPCNTEPLLLPCHSCTTAARGTVKPFPSDSPWTPGRAASSTPRAPLTLCFPN